MFSPTLLSETFTVPDTPVPLSKPEMRISAQEETWYLKKKKKYPSSCTSETWKVSFKPAMPNKENNPFWVIIGNVSGSRMSSYGWRRIHIPFKSLHLTLNSQPSRDVLCLVCKRETTYSFCPGQLRPAEWQKCLCLLVIARLNKNWLQKKSYQPNLSL